MILGVEPAELNALNLMISPRENGFASKNTPAPAPGAPRVTAKELGNLALRL
jgi:hypothetical protein